MRVITSNPILYKNKAIGKPISKGTFSNFGEPTMWNPNQTVPAPIITTGSAPTSVVPKETIATKSLGTPIKTKQSTFDWKNTFTDIANIFNKPKAAPKKAVSRGVQAAQQVPEQGMTTTTKVLIGVGGVVVLGTIIYLITKK